MVNPLVEADVRRLAASDGIVFVADSQAVRVEANIEWLSQLRSVLGERGTDLDKIPTVFQLNKRDLPEVLDASTLQRELSTAHCAYIESSAQSDSGTVEAVERLAQLAGW
jgi:hypothetical protein